MRISFIAAFLCFVLFDQAQVLDFKWGKQLGAAMAKTNARAIVSDRAGNVFSMGTFTGTVDFDPGAAVFALNSGTASGTYLCKLDSSGNFVWAGTLGIYGEGLSCDGQGNIFVMGTFGNAGDVDPGPGEVLPVYQTGYGGSFTCIVKLNNDCNFVWAKFLYAAGGGNCLGSSLCLDSKQNVYIAGSFLVGADFDPGPASFNLSSNQQPMQSRLPQPVPTFFLCSLDSAGNFRYVKKKSNATNYGYMYEKGNAICTQQDEIISSITEYTNINADYLQSFAPKQLCIEKRDLNGSMVWTKTFLPAQSSVAQDAIFSPLLTTDQEGNIWMAGYFSGLIDFDPGPPENLSNSDGAALSLFLLRLNPQGDVQHVAQMNHAEGKSVVLGQILTDKDGSCYLAGAFAGDFDFNPGLTMAKLTAPNGSGFLLKYSSNFDFKWTTLIAESFNSNVTGVCMDQSGNFYFSGSFSGSGDFNPGVGQDTFTAKGAKDAYIFKLGGSLAFSIKDQGFKDFIDFFPNPVTDMLYLNAGKEITQGQCSLVDGSGKIVLQYNAVSGKCFSLDLSGIQPGVYILELKAKDYLSHSTIFKQ